MIEKNKEKKYTNHFLKSLWKGNIIIIGSLILIVLLYFFWQIQYAEKTFFNHVREDTRMLAAVIRLNAESAVLSQKTLDEMMETFLENSARFVKYLDTIAPFSDDELTAFAAEIKLSGICIIRNDGTDTQGPAGWFPMENTCQIEKSTIRYLKNENIYYLTLPGSNGSPCIILGLPGKRINKLKEQVGLEHLLDMFSSLAGIRYIRIETGHSSNTKSGMSSEIRIVDYNKDKVAEVRIPLGQDVLVTGLRTTHFFKRVNRLRNEFIIFSIIIAGLGTFFSWLLYRYQITHLNQVQKIERQLALEKEDASLGRASATITHEIRNPLNAISMGLQRLQIEADELNSEHQVLISNLLKAVQRTNSIITGLHRYTKPITPRPQKVRLDSIIEHILSLYQRSCINASIRIDYKPEYHQTIIADSDLMEEVVENLIKNSIEAQPNGGYIKIRLFKQSTDLILSVENSGSVLSEGEAEQILAPYFTTKIRGTGIGLSIVKRIISGHAGRMEVLIPGSGQVQINIFLPIKRDYHENSRC